jgi:hypothetical protein
VSDTAWFPAAAASGRLAFVNVHQDMNLWSIAIDERTGAAFGPLRRLTRGPGIQNFLCTTADGRVLFHASGRAFRLGILRRDLESGEETSVPIDPAHADAGYPAISPSGRFVSFQTRGYGGLGYADGTSETSNSGLYLRDRQTGTTTAIPRPTALPASSYDSCAASAVSDVGSVVFHCNYNWTGPGSYPQVFLFVPGAGAPEMISGTTGGQPGNNSAGASLGVNASGLSMAWESSASNVDPGDGNGVSDIFVLVEESVISETIFANGFETVQSLRKESGHLRAVPIAAGAYGNAARN